MPHVLDPALMRDSGSSDARWLLISTKSYGLRGLPTVKAKKKSAYRTEQRNAEGIPDRHDGSRLCVE